MGRTIINSLVVFYCQLILCQHSTFVQNLVVGSFQVSSEQGVKVAHMSQGLSKLLFKHSHLYAFRNIFFHCALLYFKAIKILTKPGENCLFFTSSHLCSTSSAGNFSLSSQSFSDSRLNFESAKENQLSAGHCSSQLDLTVSFVEC